MGCATVLVCHIEQVLSSFRSSLLGFSSACMHCGLYLHSLIFIIPLLQEFKWVYMSALKMPACRSLWSTALP